MLPEPTEAESCDNKWPRLPGDPTAKQRAQAIYIDWLHAMNSTDVQKRLTTSSTKAGLTNLDLLYLESESEDPEVRELATNQFKPIGLRKRSGKLKRGESVKEIALFWGVQELAPAPEPTPAVEPLPTEVGERKLPAHVAFQRGRVAVAFAAQLFCDPHNEMTIWDCTDLAAQRYGVSVGYVRGPMLEQAAMAEHFREQGLPLGQQAVTVNGKNGASRNHVPSEQKGQA